LARKRQPPIDAETARTIGRLLRSLRKAAGFRAVRDAASRRECPAALQTIYAYERGGLVPSLKQFLDLVEFYSLNSPGAPPAIRHEAVAAIVTAVSLPAYHLTQAMGLIERLTAPRASREKP